MIKHKRDELNEVNTKRFTLLRDSVKRMWKDGLNSLQYKVINYHFDSFMLRLPLSTVY